MKKPNSYKLIIFFLLLLILPLIEVKFVVDKKIESHGGWEYFFDMAKYTLGLISPVDDLAVIEVKRNAVLLGWTKLDADKVGEVVYRGRHFGTGITNLFGLNTAYSGSKHTPFPRNPGTIPSPGKEQVTVMEMLKCDTTYHFFIETVWPKSRFFVYSNEVVASTSPCPLMITSIKPTQDSTMGQHEITIKGYGFDKTIKVQLMINSYQKKENQHDVYSNSTIQIESKNTINAVLPLEIKSGFYDILLTNAKGEKVKLNKGYHVPDKIAPGMITDLRLRKKDKGSFLLEWTAPGDDEYSGKAASYDIRYHTSAITDNNWHETNTNNIKPLYSPSSAGKKESTEVTGLFCNKIFYFAIKTKDEEKNMSNLSNIFSVKTAPCPHLPPRIISISPSSVTTGSPRKITIKGENFEPGARVNFLKNDFLHSPYPYKISYPVQGAIEDMVISGHYIYLATGRGGVQILRRDNPLTPTLVALCDTRGHANKLAVSGHYLYVADGDEGLAIIDIRDPKIPVLVKSFKTKAMAIDLAVSGSTVYVIGPNSLSVIDVTVPPSPVLISNKYYLSDPFDIAVFGHYAFIADKNDGVIICDISDPKSPRHVETFGDEAQRVTISNGLAFVITHSGLKIFDVGTPGKSFLRGTYRVKLYKPHFNYNQPTVDLFLYNDSAFVLDGKKLRVIDTSNPDVPRLKGFFDQRVNDNLFIIKVMGKNLYLGGGTHVRGFELYKNRESTTVVNSNTIMAVLPKGFSAGDYSLLVTNPDGQENIIHDNFTALDHIVPSPITDLEGGDVFPNEVELLWTAAGDDGGLPALDYEIRYASFSLDDSQWDDAIRVKNKSAPRNKGMGETLRIQKLSCSQTYFFGIKTVDESFNRSSLSNIISMSTLPCLSASDLSEITPPAGITGKEHRLTIQGKNFKQGAKVLLIKEKDTSVNAQVEFGSVYINNIFVTNSSVYAANRKQGLWIIDDNENTGPRLRGHYNPEGVTGDVAGTDSHAYVLHYEKEKKEGGLHIVDVTGRPERVGFLSVPGMDSIALSDSYAIAGGKGLSIIDIRNPSSPFLVSKYKNIWPLDIAVSGDNLYIATKNEGLIIIDIADPTKPVEVGRFDTSGYGNEVAVSGNYAYVTDMYTMRENISALLIIDISNPANPTIAGRSEVPGYINGVSIVSPYAYVSTNNEFHIFDVGNPTKPFLVFSKKTFGILSISAVENNIYMIDNSLGLYGLNIYSPDQISVESSTVINTVFPATISAGIYDMVIKNPDEKEVVFPQTYTVEMKSPDETKQSKGRGKVSNNIESIKKGPGRYLISSDVQRISLKDFLLLLSKESGINITPGDLTGNVAGLKVFDADLKMILNQVITGKNDGYSIRYDEKGDIKTIWAGKRKGIIKDPFKDVQLYYRQGRYRGEKKDVIVLESLLRFYDEKGKVIREVPIDKIKGMKEGDKKIWVDNKIFISENGQSAVLFSFHQSRPAKKAKNHYPKVNAFKTRVTWFESSGKILWEKEFDRTYFLHDGKFSKKNTVFSKNGDILVTKTAVQSKGGKETKNEILIFNKKGALNLLAQSNTRSIKAHGSKRVIESQFGDAYFLGAPKISDRGRYIGFIKEEKKWQPGTDRHLLHYDLKENTVREMKGDIRFFINDYGEVLFIKMKTYNEIILQVYTKDGSIKKQEDLVKTVGLKNINEKVHTYKRDHEFITESLHTDQKNGQIKKEYQLRFYNDKGILAHEVELERRNIDEYDGGMVQRFHVQFSKNRTYALVFKEMGFGDDNDEFDEERGIIDGETVSRIEERKTDVMLYDLSGKKLWQGNKRYDYSPYSSIVVSDDGTTIVNAYDRKEDYPLGANPDNLLIISKDGKTLTQLPTEMLSARFSENGNYFAIEKNFTHSEDPKGEIYVYNRKSMKHWSVKNGHPFFGSGAFLVHNNGNLSMRYLKKFRKEKKTHYLFRYYSNTGTLIKEEAFVQWDEGTQ